MPITVPTTDDLKGVAFDEIRNCLPGIEIRECPTVGSLIANCEKTLGEVPTAVISTGDLDDSAARNIGENEFARKVDLFRETCANFEIQLKGTIHLDVDPHRDGQTSKARRIFRLLADQIAAVGNVECVLIAREPDDESNAPLTKLKLMLLARIKAPIGEQITIDDRGIAWLANTRLKIHEIIAWSLDKNWSVWRIHKQYGGSVSLQSIHAAFTWFDNNREQILKELVEDDQYAKKMRSEQGQPPAVQRLLSNRK